MPRAPAPEVRLALSNEVLKTRPSFSRAAISFSAAATSSAWARLSSWQGPAITAERQIGAEADGARAGVDFERSG